MSKNSQSNDKNAKNGYFGQFGGAFISETLSNAFLGLDREFNKYIHDKDFLDELNILLKDYANRPSKLYYAKNISESLGGAKIYLKREDLNHTGAHKINNVLAQVLLAKKMGKKRIIAETGAGSHGVATATACALLKMPCVVYMGEVDTKRQALNVFKMQLLGAKVVAVSRGDATLKEAVSEAMVEWSKRVDDTYYCLGSIVGAHPYPTMVREFQKIIGIELKEQINKAEGKNPDYIIACVGGGSNAIGVFYDFINNKETQLIGVEAAGKGVDTKEHASSIAKGEVGIFHGMKSYFLQDGQNIAPVHSISAGLDYPGVGPELSYLFESGRVKFENATDTQALDAFRALSMQEGIIPALESSHALAYGFKLAKTLPKDKIIVINLSGRGDKDMQQVSNIDGFLDKKD